MEFQDEHHWNGRMELKDEHHWNGRMELKDLVLSISSSCQTLSVHMKQIV